LSAGTLLEKRRAGVAIAPVGEDNDNRAAVQRTSQAMKIRMGCWLLRQFFPKYTSFLTVTQEHLDHAIHLFNNRPWKCLNWETPYQALAEELLHLV
jgi:hypothetical protein